MHYSFKERGLRNIMKVIPLSEAKAKLGHYGRLCQDEPIIVTVNGVPVFQIAPLDDDDLIDRLLAHNPEFRARWKCASKSRRSRWKPPSNVSEHGRHQWSESFGRSGPPWIRRAAGLKGTKRFLQWDLSRSTQTPPQTKPAGGTALIQRMIRSMVTTAILGLLACSSACAAGFETVILKDNQRIVGEIIAEKANALYVDLGYEVLRVPRDQVLRRIKGEEKEAGRSSPGGGSALDTSSLFSSGVLKAAGVKELVHKFGEAVISIETPSGKGSGFIINKDGYAITNAHVIQGETRISAILYQNRAAGLTRRRIEDVEIVALNPFFDLALFEAAPALRI